MVKHVVDKLYRLCKIFPYDAKRIVNERMESSSLVIIFFEFLSWSKEHNSQFRPNGQTRGG